MKSVYNFKLSEEMCIWKKNSKKIKIELMKYYREIGYTKNKFILHFDWIDKREKLDKIANNDSIFALSPNWEFTLYKNYFKISKTGHLPLTNDLLFFRNTIQT